MSADPKINALEEVTRRYAVSVTEAVENTIVSPDDPVARQYLPDIRELETAPEELADPIGDNSHSPVEGIVHRYPDRVLLMPVKVCAVYCRFCFRRETVGPGQKMLNPVQLGAAIDYIRQTPAIWEVILSGGDPLVLSPRRLKDIIDALQKIDHVKVIRIHTRVPVADPARITDELCAAFESEKALYIAVHVNHAQELSPDARAGFKKLQDAGAVLISQTVLLKDVNDTPETLETLFRELVAARVKPYYLHHPDLVPGTGHFRLPIERGQEIVQSLRGRVSGLCQPSYVIDIPGGFGKVTLSPQAVEKNGQGRIFLRDREGKLHQYPPKS